MRVIFVIWSCTEVFPHVEGGIPAQGGFPQLNGTGHTHRGELDMEQSGQNTSPGSRNGFHFLGRIQAPRPEGPSGGTIFGLREVPSCRRGPLRVDIFRIFSPGSAAFRALAPGTSAK